MFTEKVLKKLMSLHLYGRLIFSIFVALYVQTVWSASTVSYRHAFELKGEHTSEVQVAIQLKNGMIATGSGAGNSKGDNSIRIWERQSNGAYKVVDVLLGHSFNVTSITELSNGKLVSYSRGSGVTLIWERIGGKFEIIQKFDRNDGHGDFIGELKSSGLLVWYPIHGTKPPLIFMEASNKGYVPTTNLPLEIQQTFAAYCFELPDGTLLIQKQDGAGLSLWNFKGGSYQKLEEISGLGRWDKYPGPVIVPMGNAFAAYYEINYDHDVYPNGVVEVWRKGDSGKYVMVFIKNLSLILGSMRTIIGFPNGELIVSQNRLEDDDYHLQIEDNQIKLNIWPKELADPKVMIDGRYLISQFRNFAIAEKVDFGYNKVFQADPIMEEGVELYSKFLLVTKEGVIFTSTWGGSLHVWEKE